MCGIAGIIRFAGPPVEPDALRDACRLQRHRGPDDAGIWIDPSVGGRVGLSATRLAVLDPTAAGHQPFHDPTGRFHVVHNGEIYNYREIRRELSDLGDRFVTEGDTEVVLAACARWGVDAFLRFNGMWAVAFFDSATRTGFLSRDRFGVKPLFYRLNHRELVFASELRGLTALTDTDLTVDADAVIQHLQFGYIAHPATIYAEARRLPPGHALNFDAAGAQTPVKYFDLFSTRTTLDSGNDGDLGRRVRRVIGDAVALRRVSDVPIGAMLSGGLDSSIIAYHLAEAIGRSVQTFCMGYADQRRYDETKYARLVADRLGTEHHECVLSSRDLVDALPGILDHLGEPVGDSSIVPTALISRFARTHITVALSGDGGDELFGGYWRYLGHESLRAYQRLPGILRRGLLEPLMARAGSAKSSSWSNRVRQLRKLLRAEGADPLARHVAWSRILAPEAEGLLLDRAAAPLHERRAIELAHSLTAPLGTDDPLNRILAFDLQYPLPADMLYKVDLASMMHSLEIRVPFLDPRVAQLALSLPSSRKIDRGMGKRALVDAYRGRLPDEVLDRPKQGFEVPLGELLRGALRDFFCDVVTRQAVESFGLLSYDAVHRIHAEHLSRRGEHADLLFALLSLCWWDRSHRQT